MSETGVLTEQGFITENTGFGFTPLKEEEIDPFNCPKEKDTDKESK